MGTISLLDSNGVLNTNNLLHIVDEKAANTAGGGFTAGSFVTRVLNTIRTDNISGASLSSNQITLPIGTYYMEASAPAFDVDRHKCKIRNITDSTDEIIGSSGFVSSVDSGANRAFVSGIFILAASKIFELQHRCQTTVPTNGLGVGSDFGVVEIYADIKIWKVA